MNLNEKILDQWRYLQDVLGVRYLALPNDVSANSASASAAASVLLLGTPDCFEGENRDIVDRMRVALDWPENCVMYYPITSDITPRDIWQRPPRHFTLAFGLGTEWLPADPTIRVILLDHPRLIRTDGQVKKRVWQQIKHFHRRFFTSDTLLAQISN